MTLIIIYLSVLDTIPSLTSPSSVDTDKLSSLGVRLKVGTILIYPCYLKCFVILHYTRSSLIHLLIGKTWNLDFNKEDRFMSVTHLMLLSDEKSNNLTDLIFYILQGVPKKCPSSSAVAAFFWDTLYKMVRNKWYNIFSLIIIVLRNV